MKEAGNKMKTGKMGLIVSVIAVIIGGINIAVSANRGEDLKLSLILMAALVVVLVINLTLYRPNGRN